MGYHAASAEDVYRYALRLDGRTARSLTDRFGFSIVFVNDNSAPCREFLADHFVDLCHRTADRIRFVFFADLDRDVIEGAAEDINRGRRSPQGGILGWILDRLGGRSRAPDHAALHALASADIQQREIDIVENRLRGWYARLGFPPGAWPAPIDPSELTDTLRLLRAWADSLHSTGSGRNRETIRNLVYWLLAFPGLDAAAGHHLRYEASRILDALNANERDGSWRELEPDALRPVRSPERQLQQLGWDRQLLSAVPGAGEAMRFAQRLGIGRHVPCVVVFTDVGELTVDVMSVAGMAAREIYDHVREWVDRFYERNRATIEDWHRVEEEIDRLRRQAHTSLREVREYADRAAGVWRDLQAVGELIRAVGGLDPQAASAWRVALAPGPGARPHPAADLLTGLHRQWEALARRLDVGRWAAEAIATVEGTTKFGPLLDLLGKIGREAHFPLGSPAAATLAEAREALLERRVTTQMADPVPQFDLWWRNNAGRVPSLKQFKKARKGWKSLPREAGDPGRHYEMVVEAIGRVTLSTEPDRGAAEALAVLARVYGQDGAGAQWLSETAHYREQLRGHLAQLRDTAPVWLLVECPSVTFAEALPPRPPDARCRIVDAYPEGGPVCEALRRQTEIAAAGLERHREENERAAAACREDVLAALRRAAEEGRVRADEWELARAGALAELRRLRATLEGRLASFQAPLREGRRPDQPVDPDALRRLEESLDRYQAVVRSLVFPHRHDPRVRSVPIETAPAANLARAGREAEPTSRYREMLADARRTDGEAAGIWQQVAAAASRWTPAAVLADAITRCVPLDRIEDIVSGVPGGDLPRRVREALLHDRARLVLEELTDLELGAVLAAVPRDPALGPDAVAQSRAGLIDQILARAGADDVPPLFGQQAFTRLLDQVASRIEGLSPAEVGHVGTDLRRGLEQYLKQFLALYAPLALAPEERVSVTNATLGPLTGFVIRVLGRPDPDNDACRNDPRWHDLARRVRAAAGQPGWLGRMVNALQALPGLTNCFPHHVVRGVREVGDGERRQSLRALVRDAALVVGELGRSDLYPVCLRFVNLVPDRLYVVRYEFLSDPERAEREVVAFSTFPPAVPGVAGNLLEAIYRQILMMIPFTEPERIDPLLAPLVPV